MHKLMTTSLGCGLRARWPRAVLGAGVVLTLWPAAAAGQPRGVVEGQVRDQTGAALPGVAVVLRAQEIERTAYTDGAGRYRFDSVAPGACGVTFSLLNFAGLSEANLVVPLDGEVSLDATLTLAVTADVTVTGRGSFVNLAEVDDPARSLVGVAFAASQGAVTASQFDTRPILRAGEVLETVPGVIVSQHSGEGKANQYYLRGFNLDHGTDFATTVAGVPVNLPTHGHGHGYADANFLIPELVSGVQYAKGPYFAEHGDFSAAGSANINYANVLDRPIVRVSRGEDGWARALLAASPRLGSGHLLAALEAGQNDGPWERPDHFGKLNAVLRWSRGDARNGLSITGLGYRASWDSTDQVPARAIAGRTIGRFGVIDPSDGGDTARYSAIVDLQRSAPRRSTRLTAYGFYYDLNLFSNFTYFLDDPENGDQFEQADRRFVTGVRVTHRRLGVWSGRAVQHTLGLQLRNDDIGTVGLYRTRARDRFATVREDGVRQTSGAVFYENQYQWTPMLRTQLGLRSDVYHFRVDSDHPSNSGARTDAIASPKAGAVIGPWGGTEFYLNAGLGFHSNDARGATMSVDPVTGEPAAPVTPLVHASGAEVGIRSVRIPRAQLTATLWTLGLESELLFVGDAGTTDATRPSRRTGVELTAYVTPRRWLTIDADLAVSRARFTDRDAVGDRIPGAVRTVVSAGVSLTDWRRLFGSTRLRYFGPRPLVEDDSIRSNGTTIVNLQAGYRVSHGLRLVLDIFNLFDVDASDIDYFYTSRLRGEPAGGVDDVHLHPVLPATLRLGLHVDF
jgi:hypothetical protein